MATPNQLAEFNPISFTLQNEMRDGLVTMILPVRPEELTKSDPSRTTIHQTLGGAWADGFGAGLSTIQLSGTCGWGQGGLPDGRNRFQILFDQVFKQWHIQRDEAVQAGIDPDVVQLIFDDVLNQYTQVVIPMQFTLKRSRTRPLLFQYMINLTAIASDLSAVPEPNLMTYPLALRAFRIAQGSISDAMDILRGIGGTFLGPFQGMLNDLLGVAGNVMQAANDALGQIIPGGIPVLALGQTTAAAMTNTLTVLNAAIPMTQAQGLIMGTLASNFQAQRAVMGTVLAQPTTVPNYSQLFTPANATQAATADFFNVNPLTEVFAAPAQTIQMTSSAATSLQALSTMDAVLAPMPLQTLAQNMQNVNNGFNIVRIQ